MTANESRIVTGLEPHPSIPLLDAPTLALLSDELRKEYIDNRRDMVMLTVTNPSVYGWEPEVWRLADEQQRILREKYPVGVIEELDLGGNRASKSERAAKRMMQLLRDTPGARVWCLQSKEDISRIAQQSLFWKYMPLEWKRESGKLKQGVTTKIAYSVATGFTDNNFVCPNGSQCSFKFYSVDVTTVEGPELDAAWADELVPPPWLEFLRYRLVTRNGLLLTTFTPVEGYSPTVAEYLRDAITLEEIETDPDLLPLKNEAGDVIGGEKVPRLQQSGNPRARIVYFNTNDNPFGNPESMKQTLKGKSRITILMRFYGVPTRASATVFPLFKEVIHVISPEKFAAIEKLNGTRFHLVDPCSGRNWFMIWIFIDSLSRKFIYREWPSYGHPQAYIPGVGELGPWTVPGKPDDGERGPGQRELGWGLKRYIAEIERLETLGVSVLAEPQTIPHERQARESTHSDSGASDSRSDSRGVQGFQPREEIFERWIDARYANARTVSTEQSTTLIEQLDDAGMSFMASKSEKQIFSGSESGSIRLISDALYYDESKPIDHLNQPHLYVLSTCPNTIYALLNWTGRDGQHGACKDPIDTLRMAELSDINYCDPAALKVRAPFAQSRRAA